MLLLFSSNRDLLLTVLQQLFHQGLDCLHLALCHSPSLIKSNFLKRLQQSVLKLFLMLFELNLCLLEYLLILDYESFPHKTSYLLHLSRVHYSRGLHLYSCSDYRYNLCSLKNFQPCLSDFRSANESINYDKNPFQSVLDFRY